MEQRPVECQIRQATVNVTWMKMRQGKGAKATVEHRPFACDHASRCPKSSLCRFVNPLSNRYPFPQALPTPPTPDHQAS